MDAVVVEMKNHTNLPTEIYSLDFDKQYLEEEEYFKNRTDYIDNFLYIPPRVPGEKIVPSSQLEEEQEERSEKDEVQKEDKYEEMQPEPRESPLPSKYEVNSS